ncbi:MAG: hypothetical protein K9J12_02940 [Melioribacteraceae bacterium]|nr:hypothetical protein [Melioribacteraceae bacterium]MCF8263335.1 hypothetical protein [Melioribacteraceae bacterium]MCF8414089.1 hypothetical protein [Melioribacteraceae bacterium]MCF8431448.1 hypothetical protein [Melioribacteraceae bacterium]
MTREEKEKIKKITRERITELENEIEMLRQNVEPISPDSAYGRLSRMDAINNQAIDNAALKDKKTLLERLHFALTKLDSQEYGKCYKCKTEIPIKRLESIPYAHLCIRCSGR